MRQGTGIASTATLISFHFSFSRPGTAVMAPDGLERLYCL
jgi:hypothetical protein